MVATRIITVFIFVALVTGNCHRLVRSPDKMEVVFPNYGTEGEAVHQNHQDKVNEEGAYWQGQGEDKAGQVEENREKNSEKNEQEFENEKEYREQQQQDFHNELVEAYNDNINKGETQHQENVEHYNQHNNDLGSKRNETNDELNQELQSKEDRYEDKGKKNVSDTRDQMETYNSSSQGPSFSYQRD